MIYEDFGGFDALYLRMLASGIPTAVQLMWIPFSELNFRQQFLLVTRLCHQCLNGLWSLKLVARGRDWICEKFRNVNDDIMMMIVFPTVEFVIPYRVFIIAFTWPLLYCLIFLLVFNCVFRAVSCCCGVGEDAAGYGVARVSRSICCFNVVLEVAI